MGRLNPEICSAQSVKGGIGMTLEEKARIRELPILIANENDPEKMKLFAAELERLLVAETRERMKIDWRQIR